ncbi:MAG: shikimate kinase [Bryobacterales bacterium]|jgi:shikimate kinase|nr:shikimate kinase [Bryobacterales bacterium]
MHIKLKRAPGIYLAGFMGSGKSTVGTALAAHLGWEFVDLDAEIEASEGEPVAKLFDTRGETEFRRLEKEAIKRRVRKIECGCPTVVALGGGAFVEPGNYELIENHGVTIWLDCEFEEIERRLASQGTDRPLARDPVRFRQLYEARRSGYGRADYRVEGACEETAIVQSILALPLWK